ncbi:MAG TPA: tripartite tricarboxylate transporter substrate binding protein [Acetobacteraceae bacterium]|nr:tripartite tricarboxylate transporter substrate binding protein [Acetobacteraceae bacterium]
MNRRALLALSAAALPAPRLLRAQEAFPARTITVLNGYPPGGVTDTASRVVAQRMERELGQSLVVENRPGGATSLASTQVAQARPDGYTLLMGTSTLAINPALQPSLTPREPMRELAPIGMVFRTAFVLHVHPSLPVNSVAELVAHARANPGRVNFGSSGTGAVNHLCLEMFRQQARIDVTHVPYRGGAPALLDLQAGRIQAMFAAVLEALPSVRDGRTRGLGISSLNRVSVLPDLPPVAETLPGYEGVFWQGLFAPAGTPAPVIARLATALGAATSDPALIARMAEQGVEIVNGDATVLRRTLEEDTVRWGRVVREGNIRPE